MARKASSTEIQPMAEINPDEVRKEMAALSSSDLADAYAMDSYEVLKQVGRIEGLEFAQRVADVAIAQTFENIKKTKAYQGLPYKDELGNTKHVSDLEQFCTVFLGRSARRVQQLVQNLHLLGSDLYEQAEQIGFRARDYQALKALPPEDQEIVKQAIESESKDTVIELLQDMAVKHKSEKDALQAKLEETQRDHDALSKVEADTSKKLRDTKLEMEKLQLRTAPWSEKVAPFQVEIAKRQVVIDESLGRHLQAVEALDAWWMGEVANQPGYDPEQPVAMPLEVRTVLVELHDAINRAAHLVASARNELYNRFGTELAEAQQHLLELDNQPA